jgi:hypothetical protein
MKKTRVTEEQMLTILREADQRPVPEVAKKHGISGQTLYVGPALGLQLDGGLEAHLGQADEQGNRSDRDVSRCAAHAGDRNAGPVTRPLRCAAVHRHRPRQSANVPAGSSFPEP